MSRREIWEKIYQRFDVYEYATAPGWRADRPLSPARAISGAWEPLSSSRLLPYLEHSGWCYPHPLLTRHFLGRAGSVSRAS